MALKSRSFQKANEIDYADDLSITADNATVQLHIENAANDVELYVI